MQKSFLEKNTETNIKYEQRSPNFISRIKRTEIMGFPKLGNESEFIKKNANESNSRHCEDLKERLF